MTLQYTAMRPCLSTRPWVLALAIHFAAVGLVALPMLQNTAMAQEASLQQVRQFDIPAGPVSAASTVSLPRRASSSAVTESWGRGAWERPTNGWFFRLLP